MRYKSGRRDPLDGNGLLTIRDWQRIEGNSRKLCSHWLNTLNRLLFALPELEALVYFVSVLSRSVPNRLLAVVLESSACCKDWTLVIVRSHLEPGIGREKSWLGKQMTPFKNT
jgi:hypothetical protein